MRWALFAFLLLSHLPAAEVVVGPGRGLLRVEDGLKLLTDGDTLVIHPRRDGKPYDRVALRVTVPNITIRGVNNSRGEQVILEGDGVAFAATEDIPSAIIEFTPEARGGRVENVHLTGARNRQGTAAGIAVLGTNAITVDTCTVANNDQGILSSGRYNEVRDFIISNCHLHHNGAPGDSATSHNLNLGGSDARILGCLIEASTSGNNITSRVHRLLVEGSTIRDSAHRECDLVDAKEVTDRAGAFAWFIGCVIVKGSTGPGNLAVVRYGQDNGAAHTGTCGFLHCTIVNPTRAALLELNSEEAQGSFINTLVVDPSGGGAGRHILHRIGRGSTDPAFIGGCWLPFGYTAPADAKLVSIGALNEQPPVVDAASDWHWSAQAGTPWIDGGIDLDLAPLPIAALNADHPLRQHPPEVPEPTLTTGMHARIIVEIPDIGAFERTPDP
jgi:hypothetical protein